MIEIKDPSNAYKEFPGPVLLLAGPGTGKTFQLAHRVKFLTETLGARPEEMSVITFTNEAARNMREQLRESDLALGSESEPKIISTMHSLGNSIIGAATDRLGLPADYRVLTQAHIRKVLLQDAAYLALGDRALWEETDLCRRCGGCDTPPGRRTEPKCRVCARYLEIIRKCSAVDYDDQIMLACELLESHADVADEWRSRTRYLLVDEYQDINRAQFRLIQLLTRDQTDGLFVVGDDDQSIYSFRGGSPVFIQKFGEHFQGNTRIGRLSKSWRCPEHILRGARAVIATYYSGSVTKPEPTFSEGMTDNYKIAGYDVPSESWEGRIVAEEIAAHINDNRVVVIVPNSNYFPALRDALRRRRISYRYKMSPSEDGMVRFTVLADWADSPTDSLSLRHILDLIINNHDVLVKSLKSSETKITAKRAMASNLVADLWNRCDGTTSLFDVIAGTSARAKDHEFIRALKVECVDKTLSLLGEHGSKRTHLPAFLERAGILVAPGRSARGLIGEIREWRNEIFEGALGSPVRPVEIYNMPSAKGLQAEIVFVLGVTEGLMPNPRGNLEEQGRLFYVAMTRARKKLYLFSSRKRSAAITFKKESFQLRPSQFMDAVPKEHMEVKTIYPRKKR